MNTEGIGSRSRMRGLLAALTALALLATLFVADSANAQTLTSKRAKTMANSLLNKQLADKDRRLIEARISTPRRTSRRVIRFLYDDLNRQGVVCTGVIEVRRSGRRFTARFRTTECEQPGDEVLAFRAQSRVVATRFVRKEASVLRSIRRYARSAEPCEALDIPAERQGQASLMVSAGLLQATTRPLLGTLDDYSATLVALDVTDTQLAAGAAAWRDYTNALMGLGTPAGGWCNAFLEWRRAGYPEGSAPVDFDALRALATRLRSDAATVRATGRYLRRRGIDPLTANAFTLDDLIGETAIVEAAVGEGVTP